MTKKIRFLVTLGMTGKRLGMPEKIRFLVR